MAAERAKHLAAALGIDPSSALAQSLLGQVDFQGKWVNRNQFAQHVQDDSRYQALCRDYVNRRADAAEGRGPVAAGQLVF